MIAVAEACRNVAVVGAEPVALTDCLNFGNPERPEAYYQLEQCIMGIALASKLFGAPVISGNVSLYNETRGEAIYPTPVIGALGLMDDVTRNAPIAFKAAGDVVLLIGATEAGGAPESLAGSEYLELVHGLVAGQPRIDMELEIAVQRACRRAVAAGLVASAHDCSDGGLAVAVAESCIAGDIGFAGGLAGSGRWDAALFGEQQSRIIMSVSPSDRETVEGICAEEGAPVAFLGQVGGDSLVVEGLLDVQVERIADAWKGGLGLAGEGAAEAG
jgi:phosphoribosylformylglycinamidine synthase